MICLFFVSYIFQNVTLKWVFLLASRCLQDIVCEKLSCHGEQKREIKFVFPLRFIVLWQVPFSLLKVQILIQIAARLTWDMNEKTDKWHRHSQYRFIAWDFSLCLYQFKLINNLSYQKWYLHHKPIPRFYMRFQIAGGKPFIVI
jgi:hypothetical protein